MTPSPTVTLALDRRLLRHPRAYHLRRMRLGLWLYLDLLARLPAGAEAIDVDPVTVAAELGLSEGTVRSWLGHLRKAGYLRLERLNGTLRVSIRKGFVPEPPAAPATAAQRFFTVARLPRALGDPVTREPFEAVLRVHPDAAIRAALAGALAPPEEHIRRSRTALFLYLLKHRS
jgi:hypothetical protein